MTQEDTEALVQSGIIAACQGRFKEAVQWFEKAIVAMPNRADLHYHLGNTFAALGKEREAIDHLKITLRLDEYHAEACNNLGRLFHKKRCFEEAYHYYRAATQCRHYYSDAELNLGLLWVAQGRYDLAKQQFQSMLTWNKHLPVLYEQLAQLALHEEDIQQARHYYCQRLNLPMDSSETWNNAGAVFSQVGDYSQAIYAFTQALTLNPKHVHARNNRAAIYLQQHRLKEAIWEYTLYLRVAPTDAAGHYNIGVAWMLSGRLQEAMIAFQEAVKLCPSYLEAWCNLGAIYIQQANLQLAYDAYQQVLSIQATHETAQFMVSALLQVDTLRKKLALDSIATPAAAPLGYIRALFNNYADHFEKHLVETLDYQVPQQLYRLMQPYLKGKQFNTLDLGCGTGLVGVAFEPVIGTLTGVDISAGMLKEAYKKSIYHQLVEQDILSFLIQRNHHYELILCADTLVYFGDLKEVMKAVFRMASPNAYFGFSIELFLEDTKVAAIEYQDVYYHLQPTGRYQHELSSIRRLAEHDGWHWMGAQCVQGRTHQTKPVMSGLCLLQKPYSRDTIEGQF